MSRDPRYGNAAGNGDARGGGCSSSNPAPYTQASQQQQQVQRYRRSSVGGAVPAVGDYPSRQQRGTTTAAASTAARAGSAPVPTTIFPPAVSSNNTPRGVYTPMATDKNRGVSSGSGRGNGNVNTHAVDSNAQPTPMRGSGRGGGCVASPQPSLPGSSREASPQVNRTSVNSNTNNTNSSVDAATAAAAASAAAMPNYYRSVYNAVQPATRTPRRSSPQRDPSPGHHANANTPGAASSSSSPAVRSPHASTHQKNQQQPQQQRYISAPAPGMHPPATGNVPPSRMAASGAGGGGRRSSAGAAAAGRVFAERLEGLPVKAALPTSNPPPAAAQPFIPTPPQHGQKQQQQGRPRSSLSPGSTASNPSSSTKRVAFATDTPTTTTTTTQVIRPQQQQQQSPALPPPQPRGSSPGANARASSRSSSADRPGGPSPQRGGGSANPIVINNRGARGGGNGGGSHLLLQTGRGGAAVAVIPANSSYAHPRPAPKNQLAPYRNTTNTNRNTDMNNTRQKREPGGNRRASLNVDSSLMEHYNGLAIEQMPFAPHGQLHLRRFAKLKARVADPNYRRSQPEQLQQEQQYQQQQQYQPPQIQQRQQQRRQQPPPYPLQQQQQRQQRYQPLQIKFRQQSHPQQQQQQQALVPSSYGPPAPPPLQQQQQRQRALPGPPAHGAYPQRRQQRGRSPDSISNTSGSSRPPVQPCYYSHGPEGEQQTTPLEQRLGGAAVLLLPAGSPYSTPASQNDPRKQHTSARQGTVPMARIAVAAAAVKSPDLRLQQRSRPQQQRQQQQLAIMPPAESTALVVSPHHQYQQQQPPPLGMLPYWQPTLLLQEQQAGGFIEGDGHTTSSNSHNNLQWAANSVSQPSTRKQTPIPPPALNNYYRQFRTTGAAARAPGGEGDYAQYDDNNTHSIQRVVPGLSSPEQDPLEVTAGTTLTTEDLRGLVNRQRDAATRVSWDRVVPFFRTVDPTGKTDAKIIAEIERELEAREAAGSGKHRRMAAGRTAAPPQQQLLWQKPRPNTSRDRPHQQQQQFVAPASLKGNNGVDDDDAAAIHAEQERYRTEQEAFAALQRQQHRRFVAEQRQMEKEKAVAEAEAEARALDAELGVWEAEKKVVEAQSRKIAAENARVEAETREIEAQMRRVAADTAEYIAEHYQEVEEDVEPRPTPEEQHHSNSNINRPLSGTAAADDSERDQQSSRYEDAISGGGSSSSEGVAAGRPAALAPKAAHTTAKDDEEEGTQEASSTHHYFSATTPMPQPEVATAHVRHLKSDNHHNINNSQQLQQQHSGSSASARPLYAGELVQPSALLSTTGGGPPAQPRPATSTATAAPSPTAASAAARDDDDDDDDTTAAAAPSRYSETVSGESSYPAVAASTSGPVDHTTTTAAAADSVNRTTLATAPQQQHYSKAEEDSGAEDNNSADDERDEDKDGQVNHDTERLTAVESLQVHAALPLASLQTYTQYTALEDQYIRVNEETGEEMEDVLHVVQRNISDRLLGVRCYAPKGLRTEVLPMLRYPDPVTVIQQLRELDRIQGRHRNFIVSGDGGANSNSSIIIPGTATSSNVDETQLPPMLVEFPMTRRGFLQICAAAWLSRFDGANMPRLVEEAGWAVHGMNDAPLPSLLPPCLALDASASTAMGGGGRAVDWDDVLGDYALPDFDAETPFLQRLDALFAWCARNWVEQEVKRGAGGAANTPGNTSAKNISSATSSLNLIEEYNDNNAVDTNGDLLMLRSDTDAELYAILPLGSAGTTPVTVTPSTTVGPSAASISDMDGGDAVFVRCCRTLTDAHNLRCWPSSCVRIAPPNAFGEHVTNLLLLCSVPAEYAERQRIIAAANAAHAATASAFTTSSHASERPQQQQQRGSPEDPSGPTSALPQESPMMKAVPRHLKARIRWSLFMGAPQWSCDETYGAVNPFATASGGGGGGAIGSSAFSGDGDFSRPMPQPAARVAYSFVSRARAYNLTGGLGALFFSIMTQQLPEAAFFDSMLMFEKMHLALLHCANNSTLNKGVRVTAAHHSSWKTLLSPFQPSLAEVAARLFAFFPHKSVRAMRTLCTALVEDLVANNDLSLSGDRVAEISAIATTLVGSGDAAAAAVAAAVPTRASMDTAGSLLSLSVGEKWSQDVSAEEQEAAEYLLSQLIIGGLVEELVGRGRGEDARAGIIRPGGGGGNGANQDDDEDEEEAWDAAMDIVGQLISHDVYARNVRLFDAETADRFAAVLQTLLSAPVRVPALFRYAESPLSAALADAMPSSISNKNIGGDPNELGGGGGAGGVLQFGNKSRLVEVARLQYIEELLRSSMHVQAAILRSPEMDPVNIAAREENESQKQKQQHPGSKSNLDAGGDDTYDDSPENAYASVRTVFSAVCQVNIARPREEVAQYLKHLMLLYCETHEVERDVSAAINGRIGGSDGGDAGTSDDESNNNTQAQLRAREGRVEAALHAIFESLPLSATSPDDDEEAVGPMPLCEEIYVQVQELAALCPRVLSRPMGRYTNNDHDTSSNSAPVQTLHQPESVFPTNADANSAGAAGEGSDLLPRL